MVPRAQPSVVRKVLPNGLRILAEPLPGFTSVAVGVWVLHGSRDEDPDRGGISHFIEHLAFKGTPRRSARAIAEEIDSLGGTLNALTSKEYTSYYARVLGDTLPRALDILGDITLHSLFQEDDLRKERDVILQEISMVEDNPEDLVHDLLLETFWPDHSLGRPIMGTAHTLSGLKRRAVVDFHQRCYRPESIVVAAAGALAPAVFLAEVEKAFRDLVPGGEGTRRSLPRCAPAHRLLRRPVEQAHFCVAHEGIRVDDPRRYSMLLLNTILGGGMSSRLFQSIREERGLAYSIYSYHSSFEDSGVLTVYCGTSPAAFREVLTLVREEADKMASRPVPEGELAAARQQLRGNLLLGLESTGNRMNHLARNEIYHHRQIPPEEIEEGILSVTSAEIASLAAEVFSPGRMAVTVIGDLPEDALHGLPR